MKQNSVGRPVDRHALMALEAAVVAEASGEPVGDVLTNWFAPGMYARQIDLAAGSMVVGKIHKHAHLNILVKGVVQVASEFGTETITAPHVWVSEAGIKRAVLTVEEATWLTIHPNPSGTECLNELEDEVIAPSYEALDAYFKGLEDKT